MGSGPFAEYVCNFIECDPSSGEKVRAYIQEQIEFSSWIVSPKHRKMISLHTHHGLTMQEKDSMEKDVHECAAALLEACIPVYFRLRFPNGRFVVGLDLDYENDDEFGSASIPNDTDIAFRWSGHGTRRTIVKSTETVEDQIITWLSRKDAETNIAKLQKQYQLAKLALPSMEVIAYDKEMKEIPRNLQYEKEE